MNRHAIAKICWRKLDLPVRAALVACKLYREMAKKPYIRTEVSLEMEENANDFEKMAVDVSSPRSQKWHCTRRQSVLFGSAWSARFMTTFRGCR
eukprot:3688852-Rhodomonas_salina.2